MMNTILTLKNVLILITLMVFSGFSSVENNGKPFKIDGKEVSVKIRFGKRPPNCPKFGLCTLSAELGLKDHIDATAYYDPSSSILSFSFGATQLLKIQPDKAEYFNNKKSVSLEENYSVPEEIKSALEMEKSNLQAGIHSLKKEGDTYTIYFKAV